MGVFLPGVVHGCHLFLLSLFFIFPFPRIFRVEAPPEPFPSHQFSSLGFSIDTERFFRPSFPQESSLPTLFMGRFGLLIASRVVHIVTDFSFLFFVALVASASKRFYHSPLTSFYNTFYYSLPSVKVVFFFNRGRLSNSHPGIAEFLVFCTSWLPTCLVFCPWDSRVKLYFMFFVAFDLLWTCGFLQSAGPPPVSSSPFRQRHDTHPRWRRAPPPRSIDITYPPPPPPRFAGFIIDTLSSFHWETYGDSSLRFGASRCLLTGPRSSAGLPLNPLEGPF